MNDRGYAVEAVQQYRGRGDSGVTATPRDESASLIRDAVCYAEQQLAELHALVSHLEARLDTVVTPQAPSVASANQAQPTQAPRSHLLDRVRTICEGINDAGARVSALMARIEL